MNISLTHTHTHLLGTTGKLTIKAESSEEKKTQTNVKHTSARTQFRSTSLLLIWI